MDGFWIVIGGIHLSIGIDSANVDDVTAVHPTPAADQVSKLDRPSEGDVALLLLDSPDVVAVA